MPVRSKLSMESVLSLRLLDREEGRAVKPARPKFIKAMELRGLGRGTRPDDGQSVTNASRPDAEA